MQALRIIGNEYVFFFSDEKREKEIVERRKKSEIFHNNISLNFISSSNVM